ncbi:MAG TPA: Uma2 family endonuclease [Gemmatimonadaceae bacterium]
MPARSARRWSTSDVRALMDETRPWPRLELIGGELLVTPAPGGVHQVAVVELTRILADYCDRERVGVVLDSPADLELIPGTIAQPDIFVVPYSVLPARDDPFGWPLVTSLRLAVEIISPSSTRIDRVDKRDHYLAADVEEYWVMDVEARLVERWFRDRDRPAATRDRLTWHPNGAPNPLVIDLERFFPSVATRLRRPS